MNPHSPSILTVPREIKEAIFDLVVPPHHYYSREDKRDLVCLAGLSREYRELVLPRLFRRVTIPISLSLFAAHELEEAKFAWRTISRWVQEVEVSGFRPDLSFMEHAPQLEELTVDFDVKGGKALSWSGLEDALSPAYLFRGLDAPELRTLRFENCRNSRHPGAVYSVSNWLPALLGREQAQEVTVILLQFGDSGETDIGNDGATRILGALAALENLAILVLCHMHTNDDAAWSQSLSGRLRFKSLTSLTLENAFDGSALDVMLSCCPALVDLELKGIRGNDGTPDRRYPLDHLQTVELEDCVVISDILRRLYGNPVEHLAFDVFTLDPDLDPSQAIFPGQAMYACWGSDIGFAPERTGEIEDLVPEEWLAPGNWPKLKTLKVRAVDNETEPIDQADLKSGTSQAVQWAERSSNILEAQGVNFNRCPQSLVAATDSRYRRLR